MANEHVIVVETETHKSILTVDKDAIEKCFPNIDKERLNEMILVFSFLMLNKNSFTTIEKTRKS